MTQWAFPWTYSPLKRIVFLLSWTECKPQLSYERGGCGNKIKVLVDVSGLPEKWCTSWTIRDTTNLQLNIKEEVSVSRSTVNWTLLSMLPMCCSRSWTLPLGAMATIHDAILIRTTDHTLKSDSGVLPPLYLNPVWLTLYYLVHLCVHMLIDLCFLMVGCVLVWFSCNTQFLLYNWNSSVSWLLHSYIAIIA